MNRLDRKQRAQILAALVEGNSIRATARMTGVSKNTVTKLLVEVGKVCAEYQNKAMCEIECEAVEVDEIWSFCYAKQKNVPAEKQGEFGYGDVWTFTAVCAESKLVPCFLVGSRDGYTASVFMEDLAARLKGRIQLTTDGHTMYLDAVEGAFGFGIDYAMLQKIYGSDPEAERRYSPAKCIGTTCQPIQGAPRADRISTSYVERQNLTMRMQMRRFTRLTNGFSKKVENLACAVALHFMYYNFCRPHRSLRTERNNRVTPAMAAGIADRPWSLGDVVAMLEVTERDASEVYHDSVKAN